jgi:putative spermidine/putrescine transport system permease protein
MMQSGRGREAAPGTPSEASLAWLVVPAGLLVAATMLAPMAVLARYSLNRFSPTELMITALTGRNYLSVLVDPYYRRVLVSTLAMAFGCTLVTLLLGLPAGYVLARLSGRAKTWLLLATIFPLMVGNVVRSAGWMALLGTTGIVNVVLHALDLISAPIKIMYTPTAVVIGIVTVVLPYMIITLASVIEGIPRHLEEAALNLGARPGTMFRRVIVPLAMPGVVAGCALVFILCMNAFATPVLLGGPQFQMMAPAVYDQFVRASNWPLGAALSFVLLAVTLLLTAGGSWAIQRGLRRRRA